MFLLLSSFAKASDFEDTKQKLNKIKSKILTLENHLSQVNDKQLFLSNELTKINKKIDYYLAELNEINQKIDVQEEKIKSLELEITALDKKLRKMQRVLAKYLTARYKLDNKDSFRWILNHHGVENIDRLLVYYKYLVAANKKLMDDVKNTKSSLAFKNTELNNELNELTNLKQQWQSKLDKLNNDKNYQAALIKKLNSDIYKNQKSLETYRQQEANLTKLITKLTKTSVLQTKHPLTSMKKKLRKPVNISSDKIKKFNQGVVFNAKEGTIVHAISPGKVVFADWLNGYGQLLIIDHGWGFMSLYGNNASLFKKVGDQVNENDKISKIGHSGVFHENGLYFEIRHHGKAIPPLAWLQ
ncbi:MAG: hypothetical protein A3E88_04640 [Legionellales bacterium RIFCSPHIGHO2_12_FULL_35_11]|nr:MAG: hypothetical protein A3E88_04640 [Legionellales bacterium RIFCSPHIGHO2_12_FULL_35_11]